ncbi:hypothetical protein K501DRAFT_219526 [Backusella circina FSU 941]|nr:hypothetical protein K501DRAFT_219526 [Backusella circina FSU 941]
MDMSEMSSEETPFNINEPYAKNLVTIIAAVICFLTVRHIAVLAYKKSKQHNKRLLSRLIGACLQPPLEIYLRFETRVINLFSFTLIRGACPPLGAILLALALISAFLPLLLLNNDLAVNSNRAGFLGLAMVPFILASTGKNSVVALLTGISSVKLNFLHRLLGMTLFISITVHMSCMIHDWSRFPTFLKSELQLPKVRYGLTAYTALCIVVFFSLFPIRKYFHEVFVFTHFFALVFIGVAAKHTPYAMRYFLSGLFCYALNLVGVWFIKTHVANARLEILPEGCTRVSIRLTSPVRAHSIGQHINLCIPAISAFQWHPFTITSIRKRNFETDALEVYVCARGNFTRRLYEKMNGNEDIKVFVSGPFGSSTIEVDDILQEHEQVVIASGGAGITYGMRVLRELTEELIRYDEGTVDAEIQKSSPFKTQSIHFSWSVRKPLELEWFKNELEQINYFFDTHSHLPKLNIEFYITGGAASVPASSNATVDQEQVSEDLENSVQTCYETKGLVNGQGTSTKAIPVNSGRMQPKLVLASIDRDAGVYVCGPSSFNDSFRNAVVSKSVQLHCEDFSY